MLPLSANAIDALLAADSPGTSMRWGGSNLRQLSAPISKCEYRKARNGGEGDEASTMGAFTDEELDAFEASIKWTFNKLAAIGERRRRREEPK